MMEIDKDIVEACDKAEDFCKRLPFEFYWDFAEVDKDKLLETVCCCFIEGYLEGRRESICKNK